MVKIIINGTGRNEGYVKWLKGHLRKEHPKTRKLMVMVK